MVLSTRIYSLLFTIVYCIYWLLTKTQTLYDRITRIIFFNNENAQLDKMKIEHSLQKLEKVPKEVIIAVDVSCNGKLGDGRQVKDVVEGLIKCVEVVRMAMVDEIKVYLWGDQEDIKIIEEAFSSTNFLQQPEHEQQWSPKPTPTLINFTKFHKSLSTHQTIWTKSSTPLILSMSPYNTINCLPFSYLIDAEFAFCHPIGDCLPIDFQRCFQQYAISKQRKGR